MYTLMDTNKQYPDTEMKQVDLRRAVMPGFEKMPYSILERAIAREFQVYIDSPIGDADMYTPLVSVLRNAHPNDTITMYINCPGGNVNTGLQLLSAMHDTQARLITVLDGVAHSFAPILLLAGQEIYVRGHSQIMFHDYSGGQQGKGGEMHAMTGSYNVLIRELLEHYAMPFLSQHEVDAILKGQDHYFNTNEIIERIGRMNNPFAAEGGCGCGGECEGCSSGKGDVVVEPENKTAKTPVKKTAQKKTAQKKTVKKKVVKAASRGTTRQKPAAQTTTV